MTTRPPAPRPKSIPMILLAAFTTAGVLFGVDNGASAQPGPALDGRPVRIGSGIPSGSAFPLAPPVVADYRDDTALRFHRPWEAKLASPAIGGARRLTTALAVVNCSFDIECDDCDPCTVDTCAGATCSGGDAPGSPCRSDLDCTGTDPTPDGTCVPLAGRQCVHIAIAEGMPSPGCDDGLACNGLEFCSAGVCVNGNDDICTGAGICDGGTNGGQFCDPAQIDPDPCPGGLCQASVCNESTSSCVIPCPDDPACDDGLSCDGAESCVGGLCVSDGVNPCGPGAGCVEPGPGDPGPTCGVGRCCLSDGTCSRVTFADCNTAGGRWLATGLPTATCAETPCPVYGSGVAPQGTFVAAIGPISRSPCGPQSVGDDYTTATLTRTGVTFLSLETLRFVASIDAETRFSIEFFDANGLFVEDVIFPSGVNAGVGGFAVHTVVFDPPLTIPGDGFVAVSVASNFTAEGRVNLMATDSADVGTNQNATMFVDGALVNDFLGVCGGGLRDALWCDRRSPSDPSVGCPGGTCNDVPDVLAFELVGSATTSPQGACCDSTTGNCVQALPWVCVAPVALGGLDGFFQGVGSSCGICSNDFFLSCGTVDDCAVCDAGANVGDPCDPLQLDPDPCPGGVCAVPVGAECLPAPPACSVQACCLDTAGTVPFCEPTAADPTAPPEWCPTGFCFRGTCTGFADVGDCVQATGICASPGPFGFIPCSDNGDCGASGPCINNACPPNASSSGFGSTCRPNCCQQPSPSGGDNCLDAPVQQITVPALGQPPVSVTLTGNNATATFDDFNTRVCEGGNNPGTVCATSSDCDGGACTGRLCNASIFNPDGEFQDPGWWEAIHLDACANLRIDLCCTDPVLEPAWANLFTGCPCAGVVSPAVVGDPIGPDQGGAGFARGAPFCGGDNLWQTFGPLPPGTYYYPIFSGLGGSHRAPPGGEYQLHVTAEACEIAACCSTVCEGGVRDGLPCDADAALDCTGGVCNGAGQCVGGVFDGLPCDSISGVVDQCAGGACGNAVGCSIVNELVCNAAGGYWLAGGNTPAQACAGGDNDGAPCETAGDCPGGTCDSLGDVVSCGTDPGGADNPCLRGSCCLGPGVCEDTDGTGGTMDQTLCETVLDPPGAFVGGARCAYPKPPCPVCPIIDGQHCQLPTAGLVAFEIDATGGLNTARVADDFVALGTELRQLCWWTQQKDWISNTPCQTPPADEWTVRVYLDEAGLPGAEIPGSPRSINIAAKGPLGGSTVFFEYAAILDPPISVEPNQRYWIEFSAVGAGDACNLALLASADGNSWSMWDADDGPWVLEDRMRFPQDAAFCLDTGGVGIAKPAAPTGACCACDGTCQDDVIAEGCLATLTTAGDIIGTTVGEWHPGLSCGDVDCASRTAEGDDCNAPMPVTDGATIVSTFCSATDGRVTMNCEPDPEVFVEAIENDVWLEYTATCTGRARFEICGDIDFDAVAVLYTNETGVCPTACPPPLSTLATGICHDIGCNTLRGGAAVETFTLPGQCFLLRIAADSIEQQGRGRLDLTCIPIDCVPAGAPDIETIPAADGSPLPSIKNRVISFRVPDVGRNQAVRVVFEDLPAPFNAWNGAKLWLGPTSMVSENGGSVTPLPAFENFAAATLQCDGPVYQDWNALGTIHVFHEGIVPNGRYRVEVVDDTCVPSLDSSFSPPLIVTMATWGDTLVDLSNLPPGPPDGAVSILDILGILGRFVSDRESIIKTRADLEPGCLDLVINIADVLFALTAFQNVPYPFEPSAANPCDSPCVNPLP